MTEIFTNQQDVSESQNPFGIKIYGSLRTLLGEHFPQASVCTCVPVFCFSLCCFHPSHLLVSLAFLLYTSISNLLPQAFANLESFNTLLI